MTKTKDAIVKDLDQWASDRLHEWMRDVVMRYEVLGLEPAYPFSTITYHLMELAARCIAMSTSVPDAEAAAMFAALIERWRELERKREQKERTG